ncbi:hypothetical protein CRG98_012300 [Punica granatum]|uniref:RNase H type-1 domain-containing protein n=1 Tax=Punica granatum TaxID=22663 RepID=A0A2I0KGJ4_PUNGR|nr:hypothetical protein CRG98_012300 [Punica granatum]
MAAVEISIAADKMELLNPISAAMEISRRHSTYEKAWDIHCAEISHSCMSCSPPIRFTDVAFRNREALIGIACTDLFGSLISMWSFNFTASSPMQVELDGLTRAIDIARGMKHLHLSRDAKDLVDSIQSKTFDSQPKSEEFLNRFLSTLSSFVSWSLVYGPRDANFLVPNIARWARFCKHIGPIDISSLPSRLL